MEDIRLRRVPPDAPHYIPVLALRVSTRDLFRARDSVYALCT